MNTHPPKTTILPPTKTGHSSCRQRCILIVVAHTVRELGRRVLAAVHAELDRATETEADEETLATVILGVAPGIV